jgi:hypothetical protein
VVDFIFNHLQQLTGSGITSDIFDRTVGKDQDVLNRLW